MVKNIPKPDPNRLHLLADPHNVHHLLIPNIQVVIRGLYLHHCEFGGVLFPVLLAYDHLWHLDPGRAVLEDAGALLHQELAYLYCGHEWVYYLPLLEGHTLGWHHL